MKRANKLQSILIGGTVVAASLLPSFSEAQYDLKMSVKEKSIVNTQVAPVKTLKKTIDYTTLKPVKEIQSEQISYISYDEGFN